jgi:hypothetical protein
MDWKNIKTIRIDCIDLHALLFPRAVAPLAKEEWLQNLREAIEAGVEVIVTATSGGNGRLVLEDGDLRVKVP